MDKINLIQKSLEARKNSYSPYSDFKVGAALLTKSGEIFCGANIENAAYGPTNCAERTAFFSAVYAGHRDFAAIAITGGFGESPDDFCYPCGVCRQVMREFCNPADFKIIIAKSIDCYREYSLEELLPFGFGPEDLN